jgi:hypothetical protein
LCLVAGISKLQINELKACAIPTVRGLASMPLPLDWKPSRGPVDSYVRIREQARIVVEAREAGARGFELLPIEHGFGLTRLPKPPAGDVFFHIEGDPTRGENNGRKRIQSTVGMARAAGPPEAGDASRERPEADKYRALIAVQNAEKSTQQLHFCPSQSFQPRHSLEYFLNGTTGTSGGLCRLAAHVEYSVGDVNFNFLTKLRATTNGHICTYFAEGLLPRKSAMPRQFLSSR